MTFTKSNYIQGVQCHKLLWYSFNDPDKFPPVDKRQQFLFDQGSLVGNYAKKLFDGVEVRYSQNPVQRTQDLIKKRKTIFEGVIKYKEFQTKPDILIPVEDKWDIIEVKSGTTIKDVNIEDLSFQKYIYEKSGLNIRNCSIMHINNKYSRNGNLELKNLFTIIDVTDKLKDVEDKLNDMRDLLKLEKHPDIKIGPHCNNPYSCPLKNLCWDYLPEHNVTTLNYLGTKSFNYIDKGILESKSIPIQELNYKQTIQVDSEKTGRTFVNRLAIRKFLEKLEYPLYFLDFESINPAIPIFENTRPYQQIAFMFSLHILDKELQHHSFIAEGDPRKKIIQKLKQLIGDTGSIIAYSDRIEKSRLKDMSFWFPYYKKWTDSLMPRFVDLIKPFRNFYVYHPKQNGSASIKNVLPAWTDKSYNDLDIKEGDIAGIEYMRVTQENVSVAEKKKVFTNLEKYCERDTYAMVLLIEELKKLIKKS
jgi:hypothetical protein